jgi:hypothetical protein
MARKCCRILTGLGNSVTLQAPHQPGQSSHSLKIRITKATVCSDLPARMNLEGIVAKWSFDPLPDKQSWINIRSVLKGFLAERPTNARSRPSNSYDSRDQREENVVQGIKNYPFDYDRPSSEGDSLVPEPSNRNPWSETSLSFSQPCPPRYTAFACASSVSTAAENTPATASSKCTLRASFAA